MIALLVAAVVGTTAIPDGGVRGHSELRPDLAEDDAAKFTKFIQEHGRSYGQHSAEYGTRLAHFKERLAAVDAHNKQPGRFWTAAVNHLADRSPTELAMLRGYRHTPKGPSPAGPIGLASTSVRTVDVKKLPTSFTWKGHLASMRDVQDQKACGSCWAISSSTVLRAHSELYQKDRTFSTQQIVECTPNPQECGGKGGCAGATAELAMQYAVSAEVSTEDQHKYLGADGKCSNPAQLSKQSLRGNPGVSFPEITMHGQSSSGMTGWQRLPENKLESLLEALYEKGPAVVSVAATDKWSMYSSGIMQACDPAAVINHAVVLVGYGQDGETAFYQIQNSWGPTWGEEGFIRMLRHTNQEESQYCGWDEKPGDGTACKDGPSRVWVCGSCGILYDSVIPTFSLSNHGFLAKHSRDDAGVFTQFNSSTPAYLQ